MCMRSSCTHPSGCAEIMGQQKRLCWCRMEPRQMRNTSLRTSSSSPWALSHTSVRNCHQRASDEGVPCLCHRPFVPQVCADIALQQPLLLEER